MIRILTHSHFGVNFKQARDDLKKAASLSPSDVEIRRALVELQQRMDDYRSYNKQMTQKMIAGVGASAE